MLKRLKKHNKWPFTYTEHAHVNVNFSVLGVEIQANGEKKVSSAVNVQWLHFVGEQKKWTYPP